MKNLAILTFSHHTEFCLLIFQYNVFVVVWFVVSTYISRSNCYAYNCKENLFIFLPFNFEKRIFFQIGRSTIQVIIIGLSVAWIWMNECFLVTTWLFFKKGTNNNLWRMNKIFR